MALSPRRLGSLTLSLVLTAGALAGLTAAPASADSVCDPGGDICVVSSDSVATPLGLVTVTVSDTNVVTVELAPTEASTQVIGIPVAIPPGPPGRPGFTRTSIATSAGLVDIDTFQIPPGPPARVALPSLAIISIHPPSPCRVSTSGTTVVFTPMIPPGPPA